MYLKQRFPLFLDVCLLSVCCWEFPKKFEIFEYIRQLLHSSCNNLLPFSNLHNGDYLLDVKLLRANFCTNHLLEKKRKWCKNNFQHSAALRGCSVQADEKKSVNLPDCQWSSGGHGGTQRYAVLICLGFTFKPSEPAKSHRLALSWLEMYIWLEFDVIYCLMWLSWTVTTSGPSQWRSHLPKNLQQAQPGFAAQIPQTHQPTPFFRQTLRPFSARAGCSVYWNDESANNSDGGACLNSCIYSV